MSMRAKKGTGTGQSGRSRVMAVVEGFGWAVHPVPEDHDWGTDLWVQPFDDERFSTATLLGIQVKTSREYSGKYFAEPHRDEHGGIDGWWFRSDDKHIDEWLKHSVPHVLVLHCLEDDTSYWAVICEETVERTKKGGKVLVPRAQTLDQEHEGDLLAIAATARKRAQWAGSAWESADSSESNGLRAALICPRLVSPHPNNTPDSVTAQQAIAMAIQNRRRELDPPLPQIQKRLTPQDPANDNDWSWRFYAALRSYIDEDDPGAFTAVFEEASLAPQHAAAAAAGAAAHLEHGLPSEALSFLEPTLNRDDLGPEDRVWLGTLRAWCLYEDGRPEAAREVATELQVRASLQQPDPTAGAFGSSLAGMMFTSAGLGRGDIAAAITAIDTPADWWREQTEGRGGNARANVTFRQWAAPGLELDDGEAWNKLRSATMMAALAGNRNDWRRSTTRLAQEQLIRTLDPSPEMVRDSLNMLCASGDAHALKKAAHRFHQHGPLSHLRSAVEGADLDSCTITSLFPRLELLAIAGDLLREADADRVIEWCYAGLDDLVGFKSRWHPTFDVTSKLSDVMIAVAPAGSSTGRERLREWFVKAAPITDERMARDLAGVLVVLPPQDRPAGFIEALKSCREDHPALSEAVERLHTTEDPSTRAALERRILNGNLHALARYGDIRDLRHETAAGLVTHLAETLQQRLDGDQWMDGTTAPLHALALTSHHYPDLARWLLVASILTTQRALEEDLDSTIRFLPHAIPHLSQKHRGTLITALENVAQRHRPSLLRTRDLQSAARSALIEIDAPPPEALVQRVTTMLNGTSRSQRDAVMLLSRRPAPEHIMALTALAAVGDVALRPAVAHCLAAWACEGIAVQQATATAADLLDRGGVAVALSVANAIEDASDSWAATELDALLRAHPSATVRARVSAPLSSDDPGDGQG